jgi:hypothetical protein
MCDEEQKKLIARPVEGIKELVLADGAYLRPTYPVQNQHPISLNGTIIGREPQDATGRYTVDTYGLPSTVIELMKLVCTECHEARAQAEDMLRDAHNFRAIMPFKAICSYTRYYSPWHLQIIIPTMTELRAFAIKVSSRLLRFRANA